jgi:putative tricarboxylic transport membrane protein
MKIAMKKADQITAIVMLLFSAYVVLASSRMSLYTEFAPDYGFFPFWLGILMGTLSVLLFVNGSTRPAVKTDNVVLPERGIMINVVLILAGLGLYAFLMEQIGYILDTLLLVILLVGVVEREKWYKALIITVLMTALLYVIFQIILGVSLPKGPFGF